MYFCNNQHKNQKANIQTHSRHQCVAVFDSVLQCFSMDCQYQNTHPIYQKYQPAHRCRQVASTRDACTLAFAYQHSYMDMLAKKKSIEPRTNQIESCMICKEPTCHTFDKFEVCSTSSECKCESPRIPASPIRVGSRRKKGPFVVGTKCKTDLAGTDVTGHVWAEDQTRLCTHAHNMHATKSLHLNTRLIRYMQSLALRMHSSSRTSRSSRHFVLLAPSES